MPAVRVILAAFVKSLQEKKKPFWRRHWLLLIVLALIAAGALPSPAPVPTPCRMVPMWPCWK